MTSSPSPRGDEGSPADSSWYRPTDVIIVGSGVAGLAAALAIARQEPPLRILLLTRGALGGQGASALAQGGVAAALDPADSPELHALDTRLAGGGLARSDVVDILTSDGPERVRELIQIGARFDRIASGGLSLGLEGAHSRHRILHAHGDRTGAEVTRALREAVLAEPSIRVAEGIEVFDLHLADGRVRGVIAGDAAGHRRTVDGAATLLATGGPGRVYLRTTAPPGLNGDGLAMAARAGALLRDLEFVQFHPTALDVDADPLPLVTEALRGAGARLVDAAGAPVMDPEEGDELASRDRVARALWSRIRDGTPVFLDCRTAPGDEISERFPGVNALCKRHGIDPARELVPVIPAAHYHMGGIAVDAEGRSSLPGLWAVGEASASGVHGANRLASNSLLEGLVFGPRAARSIGLAVAAASESISPPNAAPERAPAGKSEEAVSAPTRRRPLSDEGVLHIRTLMWEKVGVTRDGPSLREATEELDGIARELGPTPPDPSRNLLLAARLITRAALLRTESLGSHYRTDHPRRAGGRPRHSMLVLDPDAPGGIRAWLEEEGHRDPEVRPVEPTRTPVR